MTVEAEVSNEVALMNFNSVSVSQASRDLVLPNASLVVYTLPTYFQEQRNCVPCVCFCQLTFALSLLAYYWKNQTQTCVSELD